MIQNEAYSPDIDQGRDNCHLATASGVGPWLGRSEDTGRPSPSQPQRLSSSPFSRLFLFHSATTEQVQTPTRAAAEPHHNHHQSATTINSYADPDF